MKEEKKKGDWKEGETYHKGGCCNSRKVFWGSLYSTKAHLHPHPGFGSTEKRQVFERRLLGMEGGPDLER